MKENALKLCNCKSRKCLNTSIKTIKQLISYKQIPRAIRLIKGKFLLTVSLDKRIFGAVVKLSLIHI